MYVCVCSWMYNTQTMVLPAGTFANLNKITMLYEYMFILTYIHTHTHRHACTDTHMHTYTEFLFDCWGYGETVDILSFWEAPII